MNFKKILATVAATAVAVSAMAVSVFASTVTLDSAYVGDWGSGATIPKTEFDAFSGDVKVVLTVETVNVGDDTPYIIKPMDKDKSWDAITSSLTAEKGVCKPDGFMQVRADQTEVEFVVPKALKDSLWDAGIGFQVYNVVIKSAELSDGTAEKALVVVSDADTPAYCNGRLDPWEGLSDEEPAAEEAAPADDTAAAEDDAAEAVEEDTAAEDDTVVADDDAADEDVTVDNTAADTTEDAPAADTTATAPVATGNTSAAVVLSVMAVAGVAAIAAKKRK